MEYNTDFEVRQATLDALGIDPAGLQNIYEVDLAILDAIQQGGGGGGGSIEPLIVEDGAEWTQELYDELHARVAANQLSSILLKKGNYYCPVVESDPSDKWHIILYGMWNVPNNPYQFISFEEPYEITDTVVLELSTGYMMDGVNSVLEAVLNN